MRNIINHPRLLGLKVSAITALIIALPAAEASAGHRGP